MPLNRSFVFGLCNRQADEQDLAKALQALIHLLNLLSPFPEEKFRYLGKSSWVVNHVNKVFLLA